MIQGLTRNKSYAMMTQLAKGKFGYLAKRGGYCPGYVDAYGQWNNGFHCPLSSGHREHVCCGTSENRFCCEPAIADVTRLPVSTHAPATKLDTAESVAVIFGMCVGSLVLLFVALFAVYYLARRCNSMRNKKTQPHNFNLCSKGERCVLFTGPIQCVCRQATHFEQNTDSKKPLADYFPEDPPSYEEVVESRAQLTDDASHSEEKHTLADEERKTGSVLSQEEEHDNATTVQRHENLEDTAFFGIFPGRTPLLR